MACATEAASILNWQDANTNDLSFYRPTALVRVAKRAKEGTS